VPNPYEPGQQTLRVFAPVLVATDPLYPQERNMEYLSIWQDNDYVGDTAGAGALYQRTAVDAGGKKGKQSKREVMTVSVGK